MNKLYRRLAMANIKKNKDFYLPYILSGIFTVVMFYTLSALSDNRGIQEIPGSVTLLTMFSLGEWVVAIFSVILLFYTNSFIMKRRKTEIGVYNILGMEKRHIAKVLFIELVFQMCVVIVGGLITGILYNKLMIMLLYRLTRLKKTVEFVISMRTVMKTLVLFACIYLLIYLSDLFRIKLSNPVELLQGSHAGEREPKTKLISSVLGVLFIGIGYYIAITTESPFDALNLFFVAVLFVILGTYLLFIAGSIVFLKLLRKKKSFYYKTRNFTAVSGMLYRMKQNAVGLANICILSTMVMVILSTTISMYFETEKELKARYPKDICVTVTMKNFEEDPGNLKERLIGQIKSCGRKVLHTESAYRGNLIGVLEGEHYETGKEDAGFNIGQYTVLRVITRTGYEMETGEKIGEIPPGEIALAGRKTNLQDKIILNGREFRIAGRYDKLSFEDKYMDSVTNGVYYVIVEDLKMLFDICRMGEVELKYKINFDIDGTGKEKIACENELMGITDINSAGNSPEWYQEIYMEGRESNRKNFYLLYGGLFFIGILLGSMFLMITVLIIFYKQISEGYEDKERFRIMENVGMSNAEVKESIQTQVKIIFLLPILTAGIHMMAAFPMLKRLLAMLNLRDSTVTIWCMSGTAGVFGIIYFIVFQITSQKYYRILKNREAQIKNN